MLRFDIILKLKAIHGRSYRNKTAVLTTASYFTVSTPARSQDNNFMIRFDKVSVSFINFDLLKWL